MPKRVDPKKKGIILIFPTEAVYGGKKGDKKELANIVNRIISRSKSEREHQITEEEHDAIALNRFYDPKSISGERISLIKTLLKEGYDVRVIRPPTFPGMSYHDFLEEVKNIKGLGFVDVNGIPAVEWLRNVFTHAKPDLIIEHLDRATESLGLDDVIQKELRDKVKHISIESVDGGSLIPGKDFILVSNNISKEDEEKLKHHFKEVIKLPFGKREILPEYELSKSVAPDRRFLVKTDQIDLFVGVIPDKKLLVVDPDYYKEHKELLEDVAKKIKHEIVVVPEEEKRLYPANFLLLPDGKVLLNGTKKLAEKLKKKGVKVITLDKPLHHHIRLGGGVRCVTNILRGGKGARKTSKR